MFSIAPFRKTTSLRRNEDGVTAVEFAFIAPVFLMMVFGVIEFSMVSFASTVMESATSITSRTGKTGYTDTGVTRQQMIINTITSRTAGLLDPRKIGISTEVYSTFSNVGQPEPCIRPTTPPCPGTPGTNFVDVNGNGQWDSDMGSAGLGNQGDVVVYTVTYPWPIITPLISSIIGNTYIITARTVVRNEPFGTAVGG